MVRIAALAGTRRNPPDDRKSPKNTVAVQGVLPLGSLASQVPISAQQATLLKNDRRTRSRTYSDAEISVIAHQICVGVIEVLYGNRAPSQLVRCTSEKIYNELARRSAAEKARLRSTRIRTPKVRLERVHVQRPSAKAVEICARLNRDETTHALAARLEFIHGRWMCVALETGRTR